MSYLFRGGPRRIEQRLRIARIEAACNGRAITRFYLQRPEGAR
ncbi:hypothetical protein EPIB2_191 [Tritonibacter mobilis]|nr:hypothetical protein SCH4B_0878 [Ruegeria sp. TrichCH4B]VCU61114.1 hypothetical protein EPIB2_191 [Tritonibacter mobilis]